LCISKKLAGCTNNKDVSLTILKWYVCDSQVQYLHNLQADLELEDADGPVTGKRR